ncbi:hypothetical protein QUA23_21750 [Microcoleus sp. Pol1C5]|uniref:hypothetical protein n=1 Tax=Microcoleus sp. Pol1C5 TaxID=3055406 RepID=UPI002FD2A871
MSLKSENYAYIWWQIEGDFTRTMQRGIAISGLTPYSNSNSRCIGIVKSSQQSTIPDG